MSGKLALVAAAALVLAVGYFGLRETTWGILEGGRDSSFATDMFASVADVDEILVSRAKTGATGPASCSVVVVRLMEDAPNRPPPVDRTLPQELRFGGIWRDTPMPRPLVESQNLIQFCWRHIPPRVSSSLESILYSSGSRYIHDRINHRLQIYAPERGVAASIHVGGEIPAT